MIGTLFGCATSTDEIGNGSTEETNTPADYFGIHPDYKESFQLSQGDEDYGFVNFYTEEEKELLNKKFVFLEANILDSDLEKKLIATSEDGKHKYDSSKIKIKNVRNVTWYNISEVFSDVDLTLDSYIEEPYELSDEYIEAGKIIYNVHAFVDSYRIYPYIKEDCQNLIENKSFVENLIRKQEDIYKLKYDLKTFKIKAGFQDADFLDEEKNPYLQWVNVSIPVYRKERDENSFEYKCDNYYEYTNDESLGWNLYQENGIDGDVNKIKEAVIAGKYYDVDWLQNAKIENDEIYVTAVSYQSLYYLVTLEYENLEYDVIIEVWK